MGNGKCPTTTATECTGKKGGGGRRHSPLLTFNFQFLKFTLLSRYIIKEIVSPFFICLFVFTSILFLIRSLQLTSLIINKNIPPMDIVFLFSCIIPPFLEIAIPMSLLISVIIAFSRLSADSEIIVMRATGINLNKLAVPTFFFGIACAAAALCISCWLSPYANAKFNQGIFEIAKTKASAGIIPGVFNELGDITVYAKNIDQDSKKLSGIIIGDRKDSKNPRTFIANYGDIIANDAQHSIIFRLYNGIINEGFLAEPKITSFSVTSINFSPDSIFGSAGSRKNQKPNEVSIGELITAIKNFNADRERGENYWGTRRYLLTELNRRLAVPLSCLGVALIALTLGILPPRGTNQWGVTGSIICGVLIILLYYGTLAVCSSFTERGEENYWAIWVPNLILYSAAAFLFVKIRSEKWASVTGELSRFVHL